MTGPTDHSTDRWERIAAFLDGALSNAEADAFAAEMERDTALADDVARMAGNDGLLRDAFTLPETDAAVLTRMGLADPGPAHSSVPLAANDNPPFWRRWQVPLGGALAASLALFLTLGLPGGGSQPAGMAGALEATPSGQLASLDGGASLTPVLSFTAADGRFCREFTFADGADQTGAIACRGAQGWVVEAWGDGGDTLPDPGTIVLAGGAGNRSLDETYARLGASDPLSATRESALIAEGWQENAK